MLTRFDPTRTTLLQRAFAKEIRYRFLLVSQEISKLVVVLDVFGLDGTQPFLTGLGLNVGRQEWRFRTSSQKLELFQKWLQKLVDDKILTTDAITGEPWTAKYVGSAYKKGALRAFVDSRGKELKKSLDFFQGTKEQFLRSAFSDQERLSKIRLLATRAFEELRGVTAKMATEMNRILANGLLHGLNPKTIASQMSKEIKGLSKARALVIARTEIIYAHAEGQLDTFEELGGEDVGVLAEWSTAGDDRVCPQCGALEGVVMKISEARGLLPRHPNCRCAWIPAFEVKLRDRRKRMLAAIKKSIGKGKGSKWAGKRLLKKRKK